MSTTAATAPKEIKSYVDLSTDNVSMDALLANEQKNEFVENSIVPGKIVEKRNDGALVDIGYKAEGFIPAAEFRNWADVKVGDQVDVYLEEIENENSMPGISLQKANFIKSWNKITSEYGEGSVITGLMKHRVKGGIIIDLNGVEAFLPGSQIDIGPVKNMDDFIGKEYEFKILKINQERRNIVVSRRELLEASRKDRRSQLLKDMEVNQIRKGVVKNITDFGAFIDLGGIDGLLHITDMSWGRISHPSEMLEIGQEIEVMILDIDYDKERVSLGLKQKTKNPWDEVETKYPVGSTVKGRIVNIMPYGAFVEIEQGVEGLIHVSEMSWTKRVTKAGDIVSVGEEVEAVVLDIDKEGKKISLGLRQKTRNPWEVLAEKYPAGSRIKGKVRNMTSYGAFVEIENDIDGMIHVSDMSWTRKINNPNEMLKVGDEVEAVILDIDPQQQRISLGLKQIEEDPWANINDLYKIGDVVSGKVTKITAFGAFIELSHKIDGLVHISQISKDRVEKVKDKLSLGQEIEARVIKIDRDERRIGLSIKALDEGFSEEDLKAASEEVSAALKPGEALGDMGQVIGDSLDSLDVMKVSK
ncbi:MAG: 30S ribosomal protein S1 [Victivallales bacterium]|nr:30S ribosomal protein S1 [bacterium]MDD7750088.1 30S ribosomal protein S1 [bacterium]MDY5697230.1 30S ribosomal protein S1 [Victivallales bacterium]